MNLAYLLIYKQGTFGNFEFRKSVSPWVLIIAAVFLGCQTSAVILIVSYYQQYFSIPILFMKYFSEHSSSLLSCCAYLLLEKPKHEDFLAFEWPLCLCGGQLKHFKHC